MKVWLDGRVVDGADARIPVTDHGLLYGDGVFEGIRVYATRVFRLDAHLERLALGARAIGLELPGGVAQVRQAVLETVHAFGLPDAYVRLIVTRGDGPLGVDPTDCTAPRIVCIVDQLAVYPLETRRRGLDLITASTRRPSPDVQDPRVKSLNYLGSVLAKREARLRGADDALLLCRDGFVAEAAVANVFTYRHGVLRTPHALDGALEGITRAAVLEIAQSLGVPTREERMSRLDLLGADEVFLTGTGVEVVAVRSLDGTHLAGPTPGPFTRKLAGAFAELVATSGVPL